MGHLIEKNLKKRWDSTDVDDTVDGEIWRETYNTSPIKTDDYHQATGRHHSRFVGWGIPHFHRRVRKGELIPHTPWYRYESIGSTTGTYSVTANSNKDCDKWVTYSANQNYVPYTSWMLIEDDLAAYLPNKYDQYVQEAAAKIYSSGHDTLTFLAELADVRHLFVSAAKTMLKLKVPDNYWKFIKNTRRLKSWKDMSNEWLSARYGWRTLLYDIEDLNKAIRRINAERRTRFSERAGNKTSTTNQETNLHEYAHFYLREIVQDKISVSLRGSVTADAWIPEFQFNPLVTGWELIPLSFVLDWFITVGKAISAVSFLALESQYAASCGYRIEIVRDLETFIEDTKPTFCDGEMQQTGHSEASLEVRTPCSVPALPHLTVKMNTSKVFDLLALIVQRFRR